MWEAINDWIVEVLVALSIGGLTAVFRKSKAIDNKFAALELDLAKNYVTKEELTEVKDTIETLNTSMGNKIDKVNDNILLLLRSKD